MMEVNAGLVRLSQQRTWSAAVQARATGGRMTSGPEAARS
jgi:hypothetical protein